MKKQDTLRNMMIAAGIFLAVMWIGPNLLRSPADRAAEWTADSPRHRERMTGPGDPTGAGEWQLDPAADAAVTAPGAGGFSIVEAAAEETIALGSDAANGTDENAPPSPYRMRLTLSNVGASVKSATMTDHAEALGSPRRYRLLSPIERADGRTYQSLGVDRITVDGVVLDLRNTKWHAEPAQTITRNQVEGQRGRFWIEITHNGRPALKLTRTVDLYAQSIASGRHDVEFDLAVENLSDRSYRVIVTYAAGLGIRQVNPRFDDRTIDFGIDVGGRVAGNRKKHADVAKNNGVLRLYEPSPAEPQSRLSWAATANTYFTCTIAPRGRADGRDMSYIAGVSAVDADGDPLTDDDATLLFVTRAEAIAPGATLSYPAEVYLGEKGPTAFKRIAEYQQRNYYYQISQGFGFCTFTWLVELMLWLLNGLHAAVLDFGVGIVILVLIVRTLLHPITKKGQVNMVKMQHRMQELQPKIEEIKKKYANDKARLNQEMMKLNINPMGQMLTCLPMMLQMPIWVALYISLSNNVLMRHESAFWGLTWIKDLTAPDALWTFSSPITVPVLGWVLPSLNLLPILVAIAMYAQQKLQPKPKPSPTMSEQQRAQQETMQKMGPIMSVMMLFIFYKMPSGLNLYIMSSSFFGTIEQYRIRKHIKEREADGTLHSKRKEPDPSPGTHEGQRKKPSFLERIQRMAEEAQKTQLKRSPKPGKRR